jgi:hypothetical protein
MQLSVGLMGMFLLCAFQSVTPDKSTMPHRRAGTHHEMQYFFATSKGGHADTSLVVGGQKSAHREGRFRMVLSATIARKNGRTLSAESKPPKCVERTPLGH